MAGRMQLGAKATEAMAGRIDAAPGQDHAKNVLCSICDTPAFETPVKAAGCSHLFDKDCLERWLQGKDGDRRTCPVCRTVLPPGDAAYVAAEHFVKAIIADIKVDCPQDCEQPHPKRMRYDTLAAHLRACPNTPMLCGNADCERVVPQKGVEAHAAECEHALICCAQCDKQVKRKAMQEHMGSDCPRRRYRCGYCKESEIVFANKDAHEQTCPGQVPVAWVADLRQQNRELTEENKRLQERNRELQEKHGEELKVQGRELQELRKQNAELQGHVRAALCCCVKVSSNELPALDGEYTILPERRNGCSVWWSRDRGFLYKNNDSYWMVTFTRANMLGNLGNLMTKEVDKNDYPTSTGDWKYYTGGKWEPAPGTAVTAV